MGGFSVNVVSTKDQSKMFVYAEGEILHKGGPMTGKEVFNLLQATYGAVEYVNYKEVTNEEILKPITALYGEGDWGPEDTW